MHFIKSSWAKFALILASSLFTFGITNAADKPVKIGYVEWDSCVASSTTAAAALEKAGFEVELQSLSAAAMFAGIGTGDLDAIICASLPDVHKAYYKKIKHQVDNLGAVIPSVQIGLAVPAYMDIDSIKDLTETDINDALKGRIVGIDPGAGQMSVTQEAIDTYQLPETLVDGSDATMASALGTAIDHHQAIVVTAWTPHWMWTRWDLKFLDDPKGIFGDKGHEAALMNKQSAKRLPKVKHILHAVRIDNNELGKIMIANRKDGADPMQNAHQWLEDHPQLQKDWGL